jgi:hypothetical protein
MRLLKQCMLAVLTSLVPVFIAACYGTPMDNGTSWTGRAVDKATRQGVDGIRVRTMTLGPGATVLNETYTTGGGGAFGGRFWVPYSMVAQQMVFTDVDGPVNGGPYKEVSIPPPVLGSDAVVELEPAGPG